MYFILLKVMNAFWRAYFLLQESIFKTDWDTGKYITRARLWNKYIRETQTSQMWSDYVKVMEKKKKKEGGGILPSCTLPL